MKRTRSESLSKAIDRFAASAGWTKSGYRLFVRDRGMDGMYIMIFVDELQWHPDVVARNIRGALEHDFVGTSDEEVINGAVISLDSLGAAENRGYWSFLGFQEMA